MPTEQQIWTQIRILHQNFACVTEEVGKIDSPRQELRHISKLQGTILTNIFNCFKQFS